MTRLRLMREPSFVGATLGALYVNDVWFCWTLEDPIREQPGVAVAIWKVPGHTAIPAGRYVVRITHSPRLSAAESVRLGMETRIVTPELIDVPGFTGIRLHWGNSAADTEGCPLVGETRAPGTVLRSRPAFTRLLDRLTATPEAIVIDVENPPGGGRMAA